MQERGAHAPARVGTVPARSRSARAPGRCPLQRVLGEGRLPHHPPPSQFLGVRESQVAVCGLLGERAFLWVEPRCSRVCPVCPPSLPPPRGARARAGEELTVALPGAGTPLCVPRGFGRDRNQGAALAGAGRMKRGDGPRPRASGGRAHPLVAGDTSRARGPGGAFTWGRRVGKAEGLGWDSKGPVPTAQSGGQSRPAPGIRAGRGVWVAGGQQWGPCADGPDPASDRLALDHLPTSQTSS